MINLSFFIPTSSKSFDLTGENLYIYITPKLLIANLIIKCEKTAEKIRWCILFRYWRKKYGWTSHALLGWLTFTSSLPEIRKSSLCGQSVILVRDFGHLPLVLDEPMYSQIPRQDPLSNDAMQLIDDFAMSIALVLFNANLVIQKSNVNSEVSYCACVMVNWLNMTGCYLLSDFLMPWTY